MAVCCAGRSPPLNKLSLLAGSAGVVDVDGDDLAEDLDGLDALFALADSG